jgi:hypothetical protein
MAQFGAIVRCLMVLLCLVPFLSAQQMSQAFAHSLPSAPLVPLSEAPAPVNEEDDERATEVKERLAAQSRHRAPLRHQIGSLPRAHVACHSPRSSDSRLPSPSDPDPFRNGLGSPYRC